MTATKRIIITFFLVLLPFGLFAQEERDTSDSREPNVLVYYNSADSDSGPESEGKDLFNTYVSGSLQEKGFNAVIIESETPLAELIDSALWLGAFFLLDTHYRDEIFIVEAYSTWDGVLIAREDEELADKADIQDSLMLVPVVAVLRDYLASEEVQSLMEDMEMDVQIPEPVEPVFEEIAPEEEPEPEQALPMETEFDPEPEKTKRARYHISLESGPYVAILDSAEYFPAAFYLSLHGLREIPLAGVILDAGSVFHHVGFRAVGESSETQNSLWSLGIEGRVRAGKINHLTPVMRFSAGVSYLVTREENLGFLGKIVPFVFLGGGTQYLINEALGITFFIDCGLFSEESLLISGFVPSVGISLSF